jgi:protein-disulfide isomerase
MIQPIRRTGATRQLRNSVLWVVVGGLSIAGCQKKAPAEAAPGASPTAAVAAAAPGDGSPCDQFVTKLCGRAGEKSSFCTSGKSLGKVLPASACIAGLADFAQMDQQIATEGKTCTELMDRLCKDLGPTTETCQMVRDQTPQFPKEQCEQLLGQYDQVLGELKEKEAQNLPLSSELQARLAGKDAPSFGPEDAKVTIVEFSDFQCPYCSRAANVVSQIKKQYGDKVRFVFRQFPLPMHQQAHLAAQASLVAQQQGKFWEYHDLLFANQSALTRESLEGYAKQVGMNTAELKRALDAESNKAKVDADVTLGEGVSVSGTPTVFVNGKRVPNPTEFAPVAKLIDEALAS